MKEIKYSLDQKIVMECVNKKMSRKNGTDNDFKVEARAIACEKLEHVSAKVPLTCSECDFICWTDEDIKLHERRVHTGSKLNVLIQGI